MAYTQEEPILLLQEAKEQLSLQENLRNDCRRLELQEKKLERDLSLERKAVEDQIELTVRRRKDEITDTYDREIRSDQDKLRKIKIKREKAKAKGIRGRIEDETADLREENRQLTTGIKTTFRKHRVPRFCNSTWYYALYFTRTPGEFLILLLTVCVCFLAIPCGIYWLLPVKKSLYLILIYVVDVLVFGGLYIGISNMTKVPFLPVLKEGRKMRNMIRANERKIKAIRESIEKDKNEDGYNLHRYDQEIEEVEQELEDISSRKQEALYIFENETSPRLGEEIRQNNAARLQELKTRLQQTTESRKERELQLKTVVINLTDNYEAYIGKEFMTQENLELLIQIFENGEASNMTEAQAVFRTRRP